MELSLRILPRRNPLVDEPAWKHGSLCIAALENKLRMSKFSKFMNEKIIKHAWSFLLGKYLYSFLRSLLC